MSLLQVSNSIFSNPSSFIKAGDTVILYYARDNLSPIVVRPGAISRSKCGEFPHDDMIGMPFGSKCKNRRGTGFTYLLRPTPELWTLALPHRTQILYLPDIAYVTAQLDLKPGSVVVEAGTGSGSFSHSVARTIGDHGRLFSFEFHEERFAKAETEFRSHGLLSSEGGPIRLQHRNVIKNGFGDLDQEKADAIFLDLPAPWDALEDAKRIMNRVYTSRICCFSPCMEQVQKTCQTLRALGFAEITMFETLLRTHEPFSVPMPTVSNAVTRIRQVEKNKELRRERQIAEARKWREESSDDGRWAAEEYEPELPSGVKRFRAESPLVNGSSLGGVASLNESQQIGSSKEAKPVAEPPISEPPSGGTGCSRTEPLPAFFPSLNEAASWGASQQAGDLEEAKPAAEGHGLEPHRSAKRPRALSPPVDDTRLEGSANLDKPQGTGVVASSTILATCRPAPMSRGHTSFLTFAVLLPQSSPDNIASSPRSSPSI